MSKLSVRVRCRPVSLGEGCERGEFYGIEQTTQTLCSGMRLVTWIEGYSDGRFVMQILFLLAESRHNKDDLFMKGFSYHTTSQEQAIACIIPPGSIMKKSLTSASG